MQSYRKFLTTHFSKLAFLSICSPNRALDLQYIIFLSNKVTTINKIYSNYLHTMIIISNAYSNP